MTIPPVARCLTTSPVRIPSPWCGRPRHCISGKVASLVATIRLVVGEPVSVGPPIARRQVTPPKRKFHPLRDDRFPSEKESSAAADGTSSDSVMATPARDADASVPNDYVSLYMRDIAHVDVLSAREEVLLARRIEVGRHLRELRRDCVNRGFVSPPPGLMQRCTDRSRASPPP